MLSQSLDEIEKIDLVEDMDNYLDGFCFKLDPSVLPKATKPKPTAVKIEIAPENVRNMQPVKQAEPESQQQPQQHPLPDLDHQMLDTVIPATFNDNAVDYTDFYQLQFFQ